VRKPLIFILSCCIFMNLIGCISVEMIKDDLYSVAAAKKGITQVYNYPYLEVHKAIISMLEDELHFDTSRKYTKDNTISAVHYSFGVVYAYVFNLREIDDRRTEVTLKSKGSLNSVSDKDILGKYLLGELEHTK